MVSGKKSRGPYTTNPNSLSNLPLIFDTNNDTNPNPSLISFEIHALTPATYTKQYHCSCSPNINKRKEKMGGGERKVYTLAQISEHNSRKDCWLVIEGRVCMYVIFMFTHSSWLLGSLLFSFTDLDLRQILHLDLEQQFFLLLLFMFNND